MSQYTTAEIALGKVAHAAYVAHRGAGVAWEKIDDRGRDSWIAAAVAVEAEVLGVDVVPFDDDPTEADES